MRPPQAAAVFVLALTPLPLATADTVTMGADADTGIIEGPEDDFNQGTENDLPVGTFGTMNSLFDSRGLFRFDVAAAVPAGSTITGGRLVLTVSKSPPGGITSTFEFHRMLAPWVEGVGRGDNPGGTQALAGETTWNNQMHPSTAWLAAGVQEVTEYHAAVSASQTVVGNGGYTFELTADGIADVQAMLDNPATNYGWLFKTASEGVGKTARRWYTLDAPAHPDPAKRGPPPELIVDYSPPSTLEPPDVTIFSYDGTDLTLQFFATAGISYAVQTNTGLAEADWSTFESFDPVADGTLSSTIPSAAAKRSFVRVLASDD